MAKKENPNLADLHLQALNLRKARFQNELDVVTAKEKPKTEEEKLAAEKARWNGIGKLEMEAADIEISFLESYKSKILEKGLKVPDLQAPQMTKGDYCWPSCTDCVTGCTECVTDCVKCVTDCTKCVSNCTVCITDPN